MSGTIYDFDGIGTHWWIERLDGKAFDDKLKKTIAATLEQFDQRYSRFREDSLVSELLQTGRLKNPPAEMLAMLEFAKEMHKVSQGAFDITVGNTLHQFGYGKRAIAKEEADTDTFWDDIVITPKEIRYPDGVMLDFGGFGKGWLIELFSEDMRTAGIDEFIVNGGGDLYVQSPTPVEFALQDPHDDTIGIGSVSIATGSLAASSTLKRVWQDGESQKHHIIDPRLHDSSRTSVVASFVVADRALIADTLATILILRPTLEPLLTQKYGIQAKLIRNK